MFIYTTDNAEHWHDIYNINSGIKITFCKVNNIWEFYINNDEYIKLFMTKKHNKHRFGFGHAKVFAKKLSKG